jgi:hypothetical protein
MFHYQHSLLLNWLGYNHYLKERPFHHIHPWQQSYLTACLGKLMKFNLCFNFKLSTHIGVWLIYTGHDWL